MKRNTLELAALIARKMPDAHLSGCASLAADLAAAARKQNLLATALCNGEISQSAYDFETVRQHSRLDALLIGTGMVAKLGGDPRGYTLKLLSATDNPLPHNTWGGAEEGFGVEG